MNEASEQVNDEVGTPTDEVIASFIWCDGHICVSYYNVSTLDLYITYETVDLRPDFCHLQNLFRIMPNMRNILASGPDIFLQAIMRLIGIPEKTDPTRYRLNNLKSVSAATFIVYTNNEKTLIENRRRILQMYMPRMHDKMTNQERFNFIETVVPMHQTLIVQCLGNLLHFLQVNWNHLFLREETRLVVSDVKVYKLDGMVMIDESTFSALRVFALKDHPSGFKRGLIRLPTGENFPSFFGVMNTCVSRIGSNQLRAWLFQPIGDVAEIASRHRMIEWCRNERNAVNLIKFRASLKQIVNIGELYGRLYRTNGKPNIWKLFKRSLFYTNEIADICVALVKSQAPDIVGTVIEELGKYSIENTEVYEMLKQINTIVDLDESMSNGMFCVRHELDPDLDAMKEQFLKAKDELEIIIKDDLRHLPPAIKEVTCHFVAELGFLIGFPASGLDSPHALESRELKYIYHLRNTYYYKSSKCAAMSEKYGYLYVNIRERELDICKRLMEHIYERLYDIHHAVNFCAQIDALMALASFSQKYDLNKPDLVTDRKILDIKGGWHILVNLNRKCVPNDTYVTVEKKNIINIFIAPNASGKSVYMKTVAQITYLAHIGSYVPAEKAQISVVDAIYTRMHCPESVFLDKSSFLIELQQMSNVIMNSSSRSLILVDELGQGTTENDGKSILIASLHHLARRADKSPITFVTTHYTDVYDFMVNVEWVAMKTFEMVPSVRGGHLSSFKVIDGKCSVRYAKDCTVLRRFMRSTEAPSASTPDNQTFLSNESVTEREVLEEIETVVRHKKIECAATVIKAFVNSVQNPEEDVDFMKLVKNFEI